ncbi:bifunctional phosphopantothenoylcysteine decarboxylase/phosphopantothenate--cysteine ligase CoaBC [Paracrocinitomix mangrovi]|uniref:bifunctional phosphopantothenoylcysteine decarboxylase/phosphopantothenate--cysteine ligase CoaBC n=1 Tax=Paracrocinitomix mangrovi TaxID=2862509 RepID=UPI001C8DA89B|nr:bifunctional phosphopantothenoylcysteine decarboxylase/phosphopantothenate--cysteine ligase CoaBC [Paracrocinitomix mangrovi]UKN01274.1 bifunctional phosphopantothenoylcysteine decarboxylase/phosphopantothenate--cysteine ligase CoaBC [Paracrocinitomix mangrovi]
MLSGKKILVGVTGSIAAYKSAYLVRELIKLGAEVKVVMTHSACDFISPLTLSTLSKNPVAIDFVKDEEKGIWENHVDLGLWADLFIIAPVSANSLSKLVSGNADNFLIATYLSAKCPVWIAPAMDLDMFKHFSTSDNLKTIAANGVSVIEPTSGELASGLEGKGRMEEPEVIAQLIHEFFMEDSVLKGKNVLITGGPTYEAIDPVRFIGNHSSGKTGILLADECAARGAKVTLVTGPTNFKVKDPNIEVIQIKAATEMMDVVEKIWSQMDIGIFSAAVADYRPKNQAEEKIKKSSDEMTIELVKNPDILLWAGNNKKNQYLVGFALETENETENGFKKLAKKNLDLLVLNSLKDKGAGFGGETNKVSFLSTDNKIKSFELKDKSHVAADIVDEIENNLIDNSTDKL